MGTAAFANILMITPLCYIKFCNDTHISRVQMIHTFYLSHLLSKSSAVCWFHAMKHQLEHVLRISFFSLFTVSVPYEWFEIGSLLHSSSEIYLCINLNHCMCLRWDHPIFIVAYFNRDPPFSCKWNLSLCAWDFVTGDTNISHSCKRVVTTSFVYAL